MHLVSTPSAPQPAGHYSQATIHNQTIYVAGQLPINPATGEKILGSIEDQTRQVLANISAILEASGSGLGKLLKVSIFVTDISLWGRVNEVYAEIMGSHKPARVVVPVNTLHHGFLIEVDAIAAV